MKTVASNDHCPICGSADIYTWGYAADMGNASIVHEIKKCKKCTHVFVYPLPSKEFLFEAYKSSNKSVLSDDNFFDSRSSGTFSDGDLWVLKHVKERRKQGNLIDIGAANIRLLLMIKQLGWKISIVEPSRNAQRMISLTENQICRNLFEACNFEEKFEIVSAIDVLEHTSSPIDFLKKAKSILSVSGNILLRFPNSYSLKCKLGHDKWQMIRPLGHLHFFSPRSFQTACKICGLKIVRITSQDLDNYASLSIKGKAIRGTRFLSPFRLFLNKILLGDQLLATISHL